MTNRSLLHMVLLFSLLFSELAASVHLVGHLHENSHRLDTAVAQAAGTDVQFHEDRTSGQAGDASGTVTGDCTIYHVYTGLQGCLTHVMGTAAERFTADAVSLISSADVATSELAGSRIRGPPAIS